MGGVLGTPSYSITACEDDNVVEIGSSWTSTLVASGSLVPEGDYVYVYRLGDDGTPAGPHVDCKAAPSTLETVELPMDSTVLSPDRRCVSAHLGTHRPTRSRP